MAHAPDEYATATFHFTVFVDYWTVIV